MLIKKVGPVLAPAFFVLRSEAIIEARDKAIEARQKQIERAVLKAYAAGVSRQDLAEIFELSAAEVAEMIGDAR